MFANSTVRHRTASWSPVEVLVAFMVAMYAGLKTEFVELLKLAMAVKYGAMSRREAMLYGADRGQLGLRTLLAAFTVVVAGMVVVIVLDQFDSSLGTPTNTDLSNSSADLLQGFASLVSLVEPLLLIAIGVVIIGLIRRVQ